MVDLFDDPPWDLSVAEPTGRATASPVQLLLVCSTAAFGLAVSTFLPWYWVFGSREPSEHFGPRSHWLLPRLGASTEAPGTAAWGHLMFGLALAVAVLAAVAAVVLVAAGGRRTRLTIASAVTAAGVSAIEAWTVFMELRARPPFGDSPPLRLYWGAAAGATTAAISLVAAAWSLAVVVRHQAHPM